MKIGAPVVSAMEMVQIANTPGVRISSTTLGIAGMRTYYIGRSVPWKGVEGLDAVRGLNPAVASGLEKARALSKKHTETGVSLVRGTSKAKRPGVLLLVPTKVAMMMKEAGTGELVANYLSSWQALQVMGAGRVAMPVPA